MRIIRVTVGPLAAANAAIIAASQSGSANTPLTLTAAPYVLDFARRIGITSAGDDHNISFAISGLDWNGQPQTETLAGTNASVAQSLFDYTKILSITPSAATASTVAAGTTTVASSRPINLDEYGNPQVSLQVTVSGTVNATVQQSLDSTASSGGYTTVTWVNHPDTALVNLTSTVQSNYAYLPKLVRIVLNGGTGSVVLSVNQSGTAFGAGYY
jgi:hypothetical protein